MPRLTEREWEILEFLFDGYSNSEIGEHLQLSRFTVRDYVSRLLAKFQARNRTALVIKVTMLRRRFHRSLRP